MDGQIVLKKSQGENEWYPVSSSSRGTNQWHSSITAAMTPQKQQSGNITYHNKALCIVTLLLLAVIMALICACITLGVEVSKLKIQMASLETAATLQQQLITSATTGSQGPPGPPGVNGTTGATGPVGPPGDMGAVGPAGKVKQHGSTGSSSTSDQLVHGMDIQ
jgi:hypothetical protein